MSTAVYRRPKMAYHWPKVTRSKKNGGSISSDNSTDGERCECSNWSHTNCTHQVELSRNQEHVRNQRTSFAGGHIWANERNAKTTIETQRMVHVKNTKWTKHLHLVGISLAFLVIVSCSQLTSCDNNEKTRTDIQRVSTPAPIIKSELVSQPIEKPELINVSVNHTNTLSGDNKQVAASNSQVFYDEGTSGDTPTFTTAVELRTPSIDSVGEPSSDEMEAAASKKKKKKMMKKSKKMEKKHKEWKKGKKHKKKKYESKKKKGGSSKKKKGKKEKKKWGMEKKGHKKKGNFKKKKWGSKKKMKKGHKKGKKGHKMLKDKGHKKKGFKKIYHKEEWGKKKKWHDIKREKKWNTKQKKWKKKWHQEKGKKYKGKHMKKYHKKNKHGKKYKKEKKSKWKKHKGEKFKKGHKKKKEEYSKKKEGGKKKKMKKMKKEMKKKKKG